MSQVERAKKKQAENAAKLLARIDQARRLRPKRIADNVSSALQAFGQRRAA